jgi:predicted nucleic acid-binding protein
MDIVYIETSVISHAAARDSSDPEVRVLQIQARRWLAEQRLRFQVVTSRLVLDEAARGDPEAAQKRLKLLADIPVLAANPDVEEVAEQLITRSLLPARARLDASHVATAALAGAQFLLTQNCRHIANATMLPGVYALLAELGLAGLLIYTPAEFLGAGFDEQQSDS